MFVNQGGKFNSKIVSLSINLRDPIALKAANFYAVLLVCASISFIKSLLNEMLSINHLQVCHHKPFYYVQLTRFRSFSDFVELL